MYGTAWCQDCKRAKQFFGEHRIGYTFIDVDEDADGLRVVEQHNGGKHVIPTIVFADGSVLVEPSNVALAAKLGNESVISLAGVTRLDRGGTRPPGAF